MTDKPKTKKQTVKPLPKFFRLTKKRMDRKYFVFDRNKKLSEMNLRELRYVVSELQELVDDMDANLAQARLWLLRAMP